MIHPTLPRAVSGPLLLVDIGGYTAFLQSVASAHANDAFADGAVPDAYALVSSLLDGIVERIVPPFSLSKLEGDAVFAYAIDPSAVPRGAGLLECLAACYLDFRARLDQARGIWTCRCDACARIADLDLKFIVHAGPYVIQGIAGGQELVGPDVVLAHRWLKSGAADLVGHGAYALVTAEAMTRLDVPIAAGAQITEHYEHYPPVQAWVFALREPSPAVG